MARYLEHLKGHESLADMVRTHIGVWIALLESAERDATNEADKGYYAHELQALKDIKAACVAELKAKP